jgi:hypothetical protein
MISPSLHSLREVRKIFRWFVLSNVFSNLPNVPKISPLGIKRWRIRGLCLITILIVVDNIVVFTCFLSILWSGTNLKVIFWEDISNGLSSVELSGSLTEELFHLIDKFIVLLRIHSRILDNQAAIFVKCFCHSFAVFSIISWLLEEIRHVNNWYNGLTKQISKMSQF